MTERDAALDEAIAVCREREIASLTQVMRGLSPQHTSMAISAALEARECAQAIIKLKKVKGTPT